MEVVRKHTDTELIEAIKSLDKSDLDNALKFCLGVVFAKAN